MPKMPFLSFDWIAARQILEQQIAVWFLEGGIGNSLPQFLHFTRMFCLFHPPIGWRA
jgi:hypothetical protein